MEVLVAAESVECGSNAAAAADAEDEVDGAAEEGAVTAAGTGKEVRRVRSGRGSVSVGCSPSSESILEGFAVSIDLPAGADFSFATKVFDALTFFFSFGCA